MKRLIHTTIGTIALLAASSAQPMSQRTFVATYGTDASATCSTSAPCRSFGAAIARTNAGGEVVVLDSGGYGPVEITQSVSVAAPRGIFAGISVLPGLTGVAINGSGIDVTLSGLSINGVDTTALGIVVQQASRVHIDRCTIVNTNVGISQTASASVVVTDTVVAYSVRGIATASGSTIIASSRLLGNETGIYAFAGPGLVATGNLAVVRSLVTDSTLDGIHAGQSAGTSYRLLVDRSQSIGNAGAGIRAVSASIGVDSRVTGFVFDSVLDRNQDGARAEALPEGTATLRLWGNRIVDNAGNGAYATAAGQAATPSIFATGNRIVGNLVGMQATNAGTVYTAGNNEIPGSNPIQGDVVVQPAALY